MGPVPFTSIGSEGSKCALLFSLAMGAACAHLILPPPFREDPKGRKVVFAPLSLSLPATARPSKAWALPSCDFQQESVSPHDLALLIVDKQLKI